MPQLVESLQKSHSTWIEIHTDNLVRNLEAIKHLQRAETQVMAVIKANAYGHGLIGAARALAPHVNYLGVSSIREVLELRENKIDSPAFLLSRPLPHEVSSVLLDGVTLSISSFEEASHISELSAGMNRKTTVHIKVDTGMGRLGIPFGEAMKTIEKIAELPGLELEGIFTHFPSAEQSDGFTEKQLHDFSLLIQALEHKQIHFSLRHAANSAGSVKLNTPVLNMIRPGLMLYGVYPHPDLRRAVMLSPVLSLKSRIVSLKRLHPGQSAGYGRHFVAEKPTTIAILPMGYSQGYPVRASWEGQVLFQGERLPLAGRVSMDYLAVNLGDRRAKVGDELTLVGREMDSSVTVEDLAEWAGTIPYEILTGFTSTIPRLYF
ncbi:MAG TPA: alanine racemase [Verrucomicrobiae bacterium]|jgi:alanine racemase|nr:alanine racemase [Verrucomicrobiae bacterium]